jgi:small subunit ribosomal protein S16
MVRIRLRRVGSKSQASFRVVAADKESPRNGRFIEILGYYNPRTEPATINLKEDRIYHWIANGAQPSDSTMQVFKAIGLLERFERFKSGEKVETLLAEAAAVVQTRNVNSRTQRSAPGAGTSSRKKAAKAEAPAAAAPVAPAPKSEEAPAAQAADASAADAPAPQSEETPTA